VSVRLALGVTFVAAGLLCRNAQADEPRASPVAPSPVAPSPVAPSSAGCPSGDETTCGRLQFEAGTRAFELGDFDAARRAFLNALQLRPHPVIRYNLALCWAGTGKPGAAIRELKLVLADDKADKDLRARAERELHSAELSQAHVALTLSDPERDRVELDGAGLPTATRELVLDPGAHHVRIISGASIVLDQDVELSPGERVELRVGERSRRIDVVLVPEANSGAHALAPSHRAGARAGLSPAWFFAAAGTTAVVTALTVWSGLDTQNKLSDYQKQLPALTQADADRRVQDGHARERRTNLLLSGSLVCAAGTAVLGIWFVDFKASQTTQVALGMGQISLSTRF
jgi:hypothetical protein